MLEGGQLGVLLDPLGADLGAETERERDESCGERVSHRIAIDARGEAAIELDEVRTKMKDVLEAREARSGVVDGKTDPAAAQSGDGALDVVIVVDLRVLGELDNQAVPRHLVEHRI
jgi:hypothetical protein